MKKVVSFLLFFVFIMLIIPALSFLGTGLKKPKVAKEDLKDDRYYLVLNHETNEIMKLTPSEYIKGVVAAEMPIHFHAEALKAQAVAAHTYALRQIDAELKNPSDELKGAYLSTDYEKFQAYISMEELQKKWGKNFDTNYQKLSDAVDDVIDEVITKDNQPIIAAFHSISGGITESAKTVWGKDVSYLSPVMSEGDELSPSYEIKTTLKKDEIVNAFKQAYPKIAFQKDENKWFEIIERSKSNTVTEIKVGSIKTTGKEARQLLKLRSANFNISYQDDGFIFTTYGYGHGVGLSQYGADYLARQGKTYDEILTYYYKGTVITNIEDEKEDNDNDTNLS